jgi:hypothetical protein
LVAKSHRASIDGTASGAQPFEDVQLSIPCCVACGVYPWRRLLALQQLGVGSGHMASFNELEGAFVWYTDAKGDDGLVVVVSH